MKIDRQLVRFDPEGAALGARRIEEVGFDALWSVEAGHDPFLTLAWAAAATERVELGTNVAVAFARSPMSMAQVAWDLQRASRGRLHLGLGSQVRAHVERRYSMPFEQPVARIVDYVRCLRAIWQTFQTGARPSYEGPFYRFTLMNPMFNPGPVDHPEIPISLAGVNRRMCRAAGEVADGFHVHPMHSVSYLREVVIPAIDAGARTRGKRATDLELYSPVFVITGEDQAERDRSEQSVRTQISFYASTPSYRALLVHHGLDDLGPKLSAHARRGEWDAMAKLIPDSLLEQVAVSAKPAELPGVLKGRYEGLLQRVSLYFPLFREDDEDRWAEFLRGFRTA